MAINFFFSSSIQVLDPSPNAAIGAFLAELFEPLNLSPDDRHLSP